MLSLVLMQAEFFSDENTMDPDPDQEPVPDHPDGVAPETGSIPTADMDAWNKLLATVGVSDSVASAWGVKAREPTGASTSAATATITGEGISCAATHDGASTSAAAADVVAPRSRSRLGGAGHPGATLSPELAHATAASASSATTSVMPASSRPAAVPSPVTTATRAIAAPPRGVYSGPDGPVPTGLQPFPPPREVQLPRGGMKELAPCGPIVDPAKGTRTYPLPPVVDDRVIQPIVRQVCRISHPEPDLPYFVQFWPYINKK
jgi:hypothetical protein